MGRKLPGEITSARTTVEVIAAVLVAFLLVVQSREHARREHLLRRDMGEARAQVLMLRQEVANLSMENNHLTTRLERTAKAAAEAQKKAEGVVASEDAQEKTKGASPATSKQAQAKPDSGEPAPAEAQRPSRGPGDRS